MQIKYTHEIKNDDKITAEEIVDLILKQRQIKNLLEFLKPQSPLNIKFTDFGSPAGGLKKDLKKTIKLLEKIKKNNQTIVVYTDYDADGITGGAILWETLYLLGFKVMPYVPHRKLEGYGFSIKGIDAVKKKFNPSLIISVDHGITAREKIAYAKKLGIPIIITDHHLKPEKLPNQAFAIFHIPQLSGSGVAYFFAKEIFGYFKNTPGDTGGGDPRQRGAKANPGGEESRGRIWRDLLDNNFKCDYLALATIGTIADLVPLIGSSRSIVKYGLEAFANCKRPGIRSIIIQAGIEGRKITPYEIGFIIAPRINAIGRLEHAIDALRLLCTPKLETAQQLASKVGRKNVERQDLVKSALIEAKKMVEKNKLDKEKIIILVSPSTNEGWNEGIIGLIASKIVEEYYRPCIIMTASDGFLKGSARSIPSFHMTNFLRSLKKYLVDVGGHAQAAGFTIDKQQLEKFITKAKKQAEKLIKEKDLEKIILADLKIPLSKISMKLIKLMEKLNPYGIGNPKPTFYSEAEILSANIFGKKSEHLKIIVKEPNSSSFPLELISFSSAEQFYKLSRGQKINIVYTIDIDRWGGNEKIRGIISLLI